MTNFDAFRPSPELVLDVQDAVFEEPVAEVNEHLSRLGAQHFIDVAENALVFNGMRYAVVGGGKDRSSTMAWLMPGTYANGAWPHIAARGAAVAHMAAEAGLRDDEGNIIPVVITGSPSMESTYDLDKTERAIVADGDFAPIAERHAGLLGNLNLELAGIVGSSQASALASPLVEMTRGSSFGEGVSAVLSEPPHGRRYDTFGVARQLVNFAREGAKFKGQLAAEGIAVINELFATKNAAKDFERGIAREARDNLAIIKGFGRGELAWDLSELSLWGSQVTVVHGSDSLIARPADMRQAIEAAREHVKEVVGEMHISVAELRRLELKGTNHSYVDRVGRFAVVTAANLAR
jgi:hypothetical protein